MDVRTIGYFMLYYILMFSGSGHFGRTAQDALTTSPVVPFHTCRRVSHLLELVTASVSPNWVS